MENSFPKRFTHQTFLCLHSFQLDFSELDDAIAQFVLEPSVDNRLLTNASRHLQIGEKPVGSRSTDSKQSRTLFEIPDCAEFIRE